MKIVVLDGYAANPGDLNWDELRTYVSVKSMIAQPPKRCLHMRRTPRPSLPTKP